MINERILQEEFWLLLDIIQNNLNWEMSLDAFDITNETLSTEIQNNNGLTEIIKEIMLSKKGLSFLMLGYNAKQKRCISIEELIIYAMRLGYATNQLGITDIINYKNDDAIEYEYQFYEYQVNNYFELIADFLTDEYMAKKLGITKIHFESLIYFSSLIGFIIRSQLIKIQLNIINGLCPKIKKKKYCKHLKQMQPNIIIIQSETDD